MGIYDLFSRRHNSRDTHPPDVFQYDCLPKPLRVQIIHIINDLFHNTYLEHSVRWQFFKSIDSIVSREHGLFSLSENGSNHEESVHDCILNCTQVELVLDTIEVTFWGVDAIMREPECVGLIQPSRDPDDAINELNARLKQHRVGYQYESGKLIKVDSTFMHSELARPALSLLHEEERFGGANNEFVKAHDHFRHARYKECLVEALKSFESVMKAICSTQGWPTEKGATVKQLIKTCFDRGIIPAYLQTQFSSLQSLLESGLPTVRNKLGGHGQGVKTVEVPESLASYGLHLAAANIILLARLEKEMHAR